MWVVAGVQRHFCEDEQTCCVEPGFWATADSWIRGGAWQNAIEVSCGPEEAMTPG